MLVLVVAGVLTTSATALHEMPHLAENIGDVASLGAKNLASLLERASRDAESVYKDILASPLTTILPVKDIPTPNKALLSRRSAGSAPPLVLAHGMGDSCFNAGMKQLTEEAGTHIGTYSTCIPTGDNKIEDTINGFLLNLDKSIDVFAAKVRNDTNLKDGFNVFALSQGNLIIRGYIEKYNSPPVKTFVSGWGPVLGVAGFPQCPPGNPILGPICSAIAEVLGDLAYEKVIQDVLFQAAMYRDPLKVNTTQYKENSMLADLDNRGTMNHSSYNSNFEITNRWVMIRGLKDTMVWPNEGEWWYLPSEDPDDWNKNQDVEPMNKTSLYKTDAFGLKTVDRAGKLFYESVDGNHMQFTMPEFYQWCDKWLSH
jgi:palmitoyl-protein thioesterase